MTVFRSCPANVFMVTLLNIPKHSAAFRNTTIGNIYCTLLLWIMINCHTFILGYLNQQVNQYYDKQVVF